MLSTAIVIFREVFEIVLILGIVLVATREVKNRNKWIGLGGIAGIAGAGLIALLADTISQAAEGLGQELFNAAILFIAALFIGWTVLWMKKHAKEMRNHMIQVGQAISEGSTPCYTLAIVVALALLREGAEIVLFTYGMIAAGQSLISIAAGMIVGMVGGLLVGILLYCGLIKLPTKHFLRVTSWLLMLLVAGMMSQGVGFLVAAGYFDGLSNVLWDSSAILNEESVIGQSFKVLLGYTARPMAIQLIFYLVTLTGLIIAMKYIGKGVKVMPTHKLV